MSRIGRKPVPVPNNVTVTVNGRAITVKGPKGEDGKVGDRRALAVADEIGEGRQSTQLS